MKLMTVKEFRDTATKTLRSREPLIIMRRGEVAGIFFPAPTDAIPFEFKKELFVTLTDTIRKRLAGKGAKEADVLEDFEAFRRARRRR